MPEFITLEKPGLRARLANRPVSVHEYRDYLHTIGRPVPQPVARARSSSAPVTYVSQVDAAAYCRWLGERAGRVYRLPSVAELLELAGEAGRNGTSEEMWPHTHAERPEIQGANGAIYLCEWTRESEAMPAYGGEPRVLGSVFYPPWLREGNNPKQVQGMMLASQGYSFVSFRVASDE